jgi:hypothetical protein
MKKIFLPFLLLAGVAVVLNSCKKEEADTETQSAVDNSICEGEFSRIMPTVNSVAIDDEGVHRVAWDANGNAVASTCPSISIDPADTLDGFPVTLVLDYGTAGCQDTSDSKVRKGKIQATFSQPFDQVGCVITINLIDYYVDNIHYEGTVTVTRNAQHSFTTTVSNGKCTNPNWTLTWASTKTLTQSEGTGTILPNDDVFIMTGSANGVNREGRAYEVNITKQLTKRQTCPWIEAGTVDLTPEGLATRTVDFGTLGQCDNQATLTINGNTFSFTLK